MDNELKLWLAVTRHLPRVRGAGLIADRIANFYLRKPRDTVAIDVLEARMELEPAENIDSGLLFCPQLYDFQEISFMRDNLPADSCFIDVGANIGFYSLIASTVVGGEGRVIAIEADPYNYNKLLINIELSGATNVLALNIGVSDKRETLRLGLNVSGNRGGNSFYRQGEGVVGVDVPCVPLHEILMQQGVQRVGGAKLDIEGFEFRVLSSFFAESDYTLYPKFIIVEQNTTLSTQLGGVQIEGDVVELLMTQGYKPYSEPRSSLAPSRLNQLMVLQDGSR